MEITGIKIYHGNWCKTKRRSYKHDKNGNLTINKKYKKFLRQLEFLQKKGITHWHVPDTAQEDFRKARNEGYTGNFKDFLNDNFPTIKGIQGGIKAWLHTDWKKIENKWLKDYKPCRAKTKGWKSSYNWLMKQKEKQKADLKMLSFQSDELIYLEEFRKMNGSKQ